MSIHEELLNALTREIIGPALNPEYMDESGEEILLKKVHGSPKARYGGGMLYPCKTTINEEGLDNETQPEADTTELDVENNNLQADNQVTAERRIGFTDDELEEEPVGLANQYLPSAMGFTVRFRISDNREENKVIVDVKSAFYRKGIGQKEVKKNNQGVIVTLINPQTHQPVLSDYWVRIPVNPAPVEIYLDDYLENKSSSHIIFAQNNNAWLKLNVYNRSIQGEIEEGFMTVTFTIINVRNSSTDNDATIQNILFQNSIAINVSSRFRIAPYREKLSLNDTLEEQELNLLYRKKRIFAIGHGSSVQWDSEMLDEKENVTRVCSAVLPVYEMPQVAPSSHVQLPMFDLSDLGIWENGMQSMNNLIQSYGEWIATLEVSMEDMGVYQNAARENIRKCKSALDRIKNGIDILRNSEVNSPVRKSFRWMNRAMLWQQQRSKSPLRKWIIEGRGRNITANLENADIRFPALRDYAHENGFNGRWRPFQLAFILMNIKSVIDPESNDREVVDLIWFPTGGGKTEAYLGLAAFNIFFRRLSGTSLAGKIQNGGTSVIMRYTLRLLTAQQYERASSLICACDLIRSENSTDLGSEKISIGLWVGSDTPYKHNPATDSGTASNMYESLLKNNGASYNFIVLKCPCCGAQIGKLVNPAPNIKIKGVRRTDGNQGKVYFSCDNVSCEYFNKELPLYVVDEDIYEDPPTLLLATVDKFAMVPWKSEASKIFGFRKNNNSWSRIKPPELIIQDELHLISGPLGTMVGLYETLIQTLCNDYRKRESPFITNEDLDNFTSPKIIASTGTISRAYEQVKSLYGINERESLSIFPPQGLEFGETWFSVVKSPFERDQNGNQLFPGRKYVGIWASGYPSGQTATVRSYAAVIQKIKEISMEFPVEDKINFYWTLVAYFNSIRELGSTSSLVFSDIRERLSQVQGRELVNADRKRYINDSGVAELTGRMESSDIPVNLKKLETNFSHENNRALDICLATNMIATGLDVTRLGLMFIHGQPKTTAEYIQASSRVGRDVNNGPGLIFVLYSPSKPRDKSQYEQFQGYHSRIYSYVEPTSVTPFSVSARERAVHSVFIGLLRHFSTYFRENPCFADYPDEYNNLLNIITKILESRCNIIDANETQNLLNNLDAVKVRLGYGYLSYGDSMNKYAANQNATPVMYSNSFDVPSFIIEDNIAFSTPVSMRGVDNESNIEIITNLNNQANE